MTQLLLTSTPVYHAIGMFFIQAYYLLTDMTLGNFLVSMTIFNSSIIFLMGNIFKFGDVFVDISKELDAKLEHPKYDENDP